MRSYGVDLRARVLAAYWRGEGSIRDVADQFEVAPRTVVNWLALAHTTGSVAPRPHGGGARARMTPEIRQVLRQLVRDAPDATLPQLAEELAKVTGCVVHRSTLSRTLADFDLTRKKRRSTRPSVTGSRCGRRDVHSAGGSFASPATA